METVIIDGHHNRNQYFNRNFNRSSAKNGSFGLSPYRNQKGLNCRSYHSGAGLFPTPVKSKSFSQTSINRDIAALSPKTPSPSSYFSADDTKIDRKVVKMGAGLFPTPVKSKSFSQTSIKRDIAALSPKTPSPSSSYFSAEDTKNDRKVVKSSAVSIPMAMKLDAVCLVEDGAFVDGFYFSELWAGPTYSNSPPPSSLPIPKFSLRPKRSVSLELPSSVSPINLRPVAKSAPASPTRERSPSPIHFLCDIESVMETSDQLYLQQESVEKTDFATKALRRILNLDNGDQ